MITYKESRLDGHQVRSMQNFHTSSVKFFVFKNFTSGHSFQCKIPKLSISGIYRVLTAGFQKRKKGLSQLIGIVFLLCMVCYGRVGRSDKEL